METGKCALAAVAAVKKIAGIRSAIQRATVPARRNRLFTLDRRCAKILANWHIKKKALWLIVPSAFSHGHNFCLTKVGAPL